MKQIARRYTRKLRKLVKRGGATYREPQAQLLCGKHAFNHILQEEKIVWDSSTKNMYIGGDDPLDKKTKINLFGVCKMYEEIVKEEYVLQSLPTELKRVLDQVHERTIPPNVDPPDPAKADKRNKKFAGKTDKEIYDIMMQDKIDNLEKFMEERTALKKKYPGKTDDEISELLKAQLIEESKMPDFYVPVRSCDYNKPVGNVEIDLLARLRDTLGLKGVLTTLGDGYPNYISNMIDIVRIQSTKPEFLGVILGTGAHYTAIVMYDDVCEPLRRTGKSDTYCFIDSLNIEKGTCKLKNGEECYTEEEISFLIQDENPTGMLFIYAPDSDKTGPLNPYKSIAYERMKNAMGKPKN